jgi:hypothetical protein
MIVRNCLTTLFRVRQTGIIEKRGSAGMAHNCGPGVMTGQIGPLPNSLAIVSLPVYADEMDFPW